jgi:hypothetical protein
MFVLESTLEVLVLFAIIGFVFTACIVWKYSCRFGDWVTDKILDKLFSNN